MSCYFSYYFWKYHFHVLNFTFTSKSSFRIIILSINSVNLPKEEQREKERRVFSNHHLYLSSIYTFIVSMFLPHYSSLPAHTSAFFLVFFFFREQQQRSSPDKAFRSRLFCKSTLLLQLNTCLPLGYPFGSLTYDAGIKSDLRDQKVEVFYSSRNFTRFVSNIDLDEQLYRLYEFFEMMHNI